MVIGEAETGFGFFCLFFFYSLARPGLGKTGKDGKDGKQRQNEYQRPMWRFRERCHLWKK